jgi:hypothetical protein
MSEAEPPTEEPRPSSRSSERLEEARRRLFEPPPAPPFWATAEFRRMGGLIFLLVMVGLAGTMIYWNRINQEQQVAEQEVQRALEGAPIAPDPQTREKQIDTAFQGALTDTKNGDPFRETSGYSNLLRELASYPPEDVAAKAKRWLDYGGALKDPDGWRGTFVRHRGLVDGLRAIKLQSPVLGVKDVWRGFMSEGDLSEKLVFDLLAEPPEIRFNYDAWDIEGVFYRTVKFEDSLGRTHEVPYVIARAIHPRAEDPSPLGIMAHPMVLLLAVVGLALFLARLLLLLAKSRRPAPPSAAAQIRRMMTLEQARKSSPPTPPPSS